jgi:hypothetical protein
VLILRELVANESCSALALRTVPDVLRACLWLVSKIVTVRKKAYPMAKAPMLFGPAEAKPAGLAYLEGGANRD